MKKNIKPVFAIANRIAAGLTCIERARGFLETAPLSEAWVREMRRRVLILEAHSTHIEGSHLPLEGRDCSLILMRHPLTVGFSGLRSNKEA